MGQPRRTPFARWRGSLQTVPACRKLRHDAAEQGGTSGSRFKLGIQPLTYGLSWPDSVRAVQAVDRLGYDYLWGHDHLFSTGGDPFQPFFEGWTTIAAWSVLTSQVRLGLLVGANPFRNPGLVAKMAATVDQI